MNLGIFLESVLCVGLGLVLIILIGYLLKAGTRSRNRKKLNWIFVLLKDGGLNRLQFRDGLFLIGKELNLKPFYEFKPYMYGPFCSEIYAHLTSLQLTVLAQGRRTDDYRDFIYELTEKGKEIADILYEALNPEEQKKISEIKEFLKLSLDERARSLSKKYPDFYRLN